MQQLTCAAAADLLHAVDVLSTAAVKNAVSKEKRSSSPGQQFPMHQPCGTHATQRPTVHSPGCPAPATAAAHQPMPECQAVRLAAAPPGAWRAGGAQGSGGRGKTGSCRAVYPG
eukprot:1157374-Pelagomonas_calceolata.AAC.5